MIECDFLAEVLSMIVKEIFFLKPYASKTETHKIDSRDLSYKTPFGQITYLDKFSSPNVG
jgi:hypothetical protein